jgi:hypothetical protein
LPCAESSRAAKTSSSGLTLRRIRNLCVTKRRCRKAKKRQGGQKAVSHHFPISSRIQVLRHSTYGGTYALRRSIQVLRRDIFASGTAGKCPAVASLWRDILF